jgi:hypothetical protein
MTITKIYVIAVIIAIVIVATTAITTTPAAAQQQQSTIHIIKHGSNSYTISGEMSSVGSFDTTYRVVGERSAIRTAENLIISTITSDFNSSATIGYVRAANNMTTNTTDTVNATTLPSPFAAPEQINERITNELRTVISEAENGTIEGQLMEIMCDFGMTLDDMRCHQVQSVGAIEDVSEVVNPQITD